MAFDVAIAGRYYVSMPPRFTRLKLAFFDIDGTLVRRRYDGALSLKSRAFNYATEKVYGLKGFDYTKILGKRIFGLTDRSIIKTTLAQLGKGEKEYYAGETALFEAIDEYFEENIDGEKAGGYYPVSGAREFLSLLRSDGIRLGLVTGNIKRHADWKMEICGFDGIFTTGGYGEDAELRADIMRAAVGRNVDIPKEKICHFGDSPPDLLAARDCGLRAVAITELGGGTHTRPELEAVGYGLIIDGWGEIETIANFLS